MITYNRSEYTKLALTQLLETCGEGMRVWVWQNGTDAATMDVVNSLRSHPSFYHLELSPENKGLREPTNWFWRTSDAPYVTKVDDDCMLPLGWAETLISAHEANPKLGVVGCWRFFDEDYVAEVAAKKTVALNGDHHLLQNCWVQGSGYVMKRECVEKLGPIRDDESYTHFCIRLALAGWQNGWYFPFIHEEHMDDPRSDFCLIKTDEDFLKQRPLSAIRDNVNSVRDWAQRVKYMARNAQEASPDPRQYTGWRKKLRHGKARLARILGKKEPWRS